MSRRYPPHKPEDDHDMVTLRDHKRVALSEAQRILFHRRNWKSNRRQGKMRKRAAAMFAMVAALGVTANELVKIRMEHLAELQMPRWAWRVLSSWLIVRAKRGCNSMVPEPPVFCGFEKNYKRKHLPLPPTSKGICRQNVHRVMSHLFQSTTHQPWPRCRAIGKAAQDIRHQDRIYAPPFVFKKLPQWAADRDMRAKMRTFAIESEEQR